MIRSTFCIILLFVGINTTYTQESHLESTIETVVNQDIWKPFKQSYETRDWKVFNALHIDDVLRAHDRGIQIGQEYKDAIKSYYEMEDDRKATIDFVMERRTYKDDVGYEVGFYRVIYSKPGEDDHISYGRFHVVLKKVDGHWKISQDWDSGYFNGRAIGKNDFNAERILNLSD